MPPATRDAPADPRGRDALLPWQIPWQGWKDVLWRVWREVEDDQLTLVASSVAFYGLLALFPTLMGIVATYGLIADPADAVRQVNTYTVALPSSARVLLMQELASIARGTGASLTVGLIVSLALLLFSASTGVAALMQGVNIAYDERETRGWLRRRVQALAFTVGVSTFVVAAMATIAVLPAALRWVGLGATARLTIGIVRWPLMAVGVVVGLCVLYRHAPDRRPPRWPWVICGAGLSTLIWMLSSLAFASYVENFGRFNRTYGAIGGGVVLLLWLFISSFAILLGAELNSELEHQTTRDTTVGPELPMGERHAHVADNVGSERPDEPPRSLPKKLGDTYRGLVREGTHKRS